MELKDGNASDGTYEVKLKLDEGEHDYYFTAYDGKADAIAGDNTPTTEANAENTPDIKKSEPTEKGGIGDWLWLIILLIIIIIVIILVAVLMRRKRGAQPREREPERERRPPEDEEEDWDREREDERDEEREREPEPEEEEELAPAKDEEELEDWAVVDEEEDVAVEEEPDDLEMEEAAAAPPKKGKMPGVVRHGRAKKTKWPAKGKMPKKGKKPKGEPELESEDEEFEVADEETESEVKAAEVEPAVPLLTKLDESATCNICLGAIKTGLSVLQCTCGKKYHEACAGRVGVCPSCDTDLTNPKVMEDDEITDDDLDSLDD
jgi:hypothetical protein